MSKEKDYLSKNLFGAEPPARGEKGYVEPGFRLDPERPGFLRDEAGNLYDDEYNLVEEVVADPEKKRALEFVDTHHPGLTGADRITMMRLYMQREAKQARKKEKK